MSTQWNDEEDAALDYLPHVDQVIYLRGIRRRMNYTTGITGLSAPISYAWLGQLTDVHPEIGSNAAPKARMTLSAIRCSLARLERAGLIERIPNDERRLVFRCLLASREQSVSGRNSRGTAEEQQTRNNTNFETENSELNARNSRGTAECCTARNSTIQGSGIKEEAKASLSAPADAASDRVPPCPHLEIIQIYHRVLPELSPVITSRWPGSEGEKHLRTRWREDKRHQDLAFWERLFGAVRTNPHWMGANDRNWTAHLRWIVNRANFDKVLQRMVDNLNRGEVSHG